ncbi:hypothetical protein [Oscillibacter sp.]|uniref:hypothetical protein n=1 Tax=Oscillibacter sp. TaxID=1945593 RepID=UPI003391A91F
MRYLKSCVLVVAAVILLFLLSACGGKHNPEPEESVSSGNENTVTEEELAEAGCRLLETETLGPLQYGQTDDEVKSLLGEPEECTEPEIWAADGRLHESWLYKGVDVQLADGTLERVTVTAPFTQTTEAGIGIGSSESEVQKAYAGMIDPNATTEETIVAGTLFGGLVFVMTDGSVTSITLGISAE